MPLEPALAVAADTVQQIDLPRESGTHADVFAAIGLADLLADGFGDRRVRIVNRGTHFEISLSRPHHLVLLRAGVIRL